MPKILQAIATIDAIGGAQRQLLAVVRGLVAAGIGCDVAWYLGRGELASELAAAGAGLHPIPRRWWDPIGLARTAALVRRGGYDVVHGHLSRAEIVAGFATILAEASGTTRAALVLHKHNEDRWWSTGLLSRIHPVLTARAAAVVVQSPAIAAFYRDPSLRIADPSRLEVIPYGIDPAEVRIADPLGARSRIRRELGIGDGAFVALAVARLTAQKRLDRMIDAWGTVAEARPGSVLAIAGRGELESELAARAAFLPAGSARLLGFREDVPALMAAADVLVLSSDYEGIPMALLQAMAFGLPIVSTEVSGIGDTVARGKEALLVPPRDAGALAAALLEVARDPESARRRAAAARERVERDWSLAAVTKKWIALYERVTSGNRSRSP